MKLFLSCVSEMDPPHNMLLFQPLESAVDATFWSALSDLKLDTLGLSEEALLCHGASSEAPFAADQPYRCA